MSHRQSFNVLHILSSAVTRIKHMKKQRRHLWKAGPDPELRERRLAYLRAKAQAKFREEGFELSLDEWYQLWTLENWRKRGKKIGDLILTRKNIDGVWEMGNVVIRERAGNMSRHYHHNFIRMRRTLDKIPPIC